MGRFVGSQAPSASGRIRPSSRFTRHQPPLAGFQARPRIFWSLSGLVSCASSGSGAVHHSPQEIVHVGQSLPEKNEVICSFFKKFLLSSPSTRVTRPLHFPPRANNRPGEVGSAGPAWGWGEERTPRAGGAARGWGARPLLRPDPRPPPPPTTPLPPSTNPGNARKVSSREGRPRSGAASSANNNSK